MLFTELFSDPFITMRGNKGRSFGRVFYSLIYQSGGVKYDGECGNTGSVGPYFSLLEGEGVGGGEEGCSLIRGGVINVGRTGIILRGEFL